MTLNQFFEENPKVALAFSGGVDSSYLLYAALRAGAQVKAYYVKTAFQPEFEYEDAMRLARELGAEVKVLRLEALSDEKVAANPANRCYYCKQNIFGNIWRAARDDGFTVLLDGTNASDQVADRPGMQALRELEVRSPLREAGLTKADVRRLSREAGLFTWDKPSYACLATRIPTGTVITKETLEKVERGEQLLREAGFRDIRIRLHGNAAVLQFPQEDMERAWTRREALHSMLSPLFPLTAIDLAPRLSKD